MKKIKIIIAIFLYTGHCLAVPLESKNRPSSYPFISGDTFRAWSNHVFDETDVNFHPESVKPGDTIFVSCYCESIMEEFFMKIHPKITVPYIIISHNTDFLIPGKFSVYLDDPKIIVWFSQNIDRFHPKLHAIPIGLANYHWQHGKIEVVKSSMKNLPVLAGRDDKLYMNFAIWTNHEVRQPVWNHFQNKSFCVMVPPKKFLDYLNDMRQYKFVLSPPGNGIDCHRTWEALLLGCIPVVKRSTIDGLYTDLPVIIVDNWNEITFDFLQKKAHEYEKKIFKREKLFADYWFSLISEYKKEWFDCDRKLYNAA